MNTKLQKYLISFHQVIAKWNFPRTLVNANTAAKLLSYKSATWKWNVPLLPPTLCGGSWVGFQVLVSLQEREGCVATFSLQIPPD